MWGCGNIGGNESNGLNFSIVSGLQRPAAPTPKENTIWIRSEKKLKSWVFSPVAPPEDLSLGVAWVRTGQDNKISFNALKKNTILLCLLDAYVGTDGKPKRSYAEIFLNGVWSEFSTERFIIYKAGEDHTDITGKWSGASEADSGITLGTRSLNSHNTGFTEKEINLTGYKTLYIQQESCDVRGVSYSGSTHSYFSLDPAGLGEIAGYTSGKKLYNLAIPDDHKPAKISWKGLAANDDPSCAYMVISAIWAE